MVARKFMTRTNSRDDEEEHQGRLKRKSRFSFDSGKEIRWSVTSISNKIQLVQIERIKNPKTI